MNEHIYQQKTLPSKARVQTQTIYGIKNRIKRFWLLEITILKGR